MGIIKFIMNRSFLLSFIFLVSVTAAAQKNIQDTKKRNSVFAPSAALSQQDDSLMSYIVEFKEPPLFLAQQQSTLLYVPVDYLSRFRRFESDVTEGWTAVNGNAKIISMSIQRKYYKSFFGMSVTVPRSAVAVIEQLPYVKKVHENPTVRALLEKSVQQIRANEVWTNYGFRGEGVVVGIIDTGIDYMHAALGGGIGPSYKVIGGYDFAGNDADPMDDNGHGTHVAGIIAADALTISGVAPKARLYAFKVLGSDGKGSMADVIAAIERTVDPNEDGTMDDKMDVVNMSLGSSNGDPDDAASVAVDNAVKLGVTFCIAAGNEGDASPVSGKENNYFYSGKETIGSPGTSRLAITVGAVDSADHLAYFSSKGPTPRYYGIKPEVVAPGFRIRSLAPGNGYRIESGTSMASPMVAGIAALLKSKDKGLTPQQIKSAIVNSSVDLGLEKMLQGAGRVDAMRAVALASSAVPSVIGFGLDDPSQSVWSRVETVKVSNRRNIQQNYSVVMNGQRSGITLSSVPQNFSVAPGGEQQVLITISVNNAVIPIIDDDIPLYDGFVHIRSSADTLHLPWSFARTTKMILSFSEPDAQFLGAGNTSYLLPRYDKMYSRMRRLDSKTVEFTGANRDTYDFVVFFPNSSRMVLKSEYQFNGNDQIFFNASDAVRAVHFNGVDEQNVPLANSLKTKRSMRVELPSGFFFAPLKDGMSTLLVSNAPGRFTFHGSEALIDPVSAKKVVLPQYASFSGIASDVQLTNTASEFLSQKLRFTVPPGVTSTRLFSEGISTFSVSGETYFNTTMVGIDTVQTPMEEFSFDLYMMRPKDPVFASSIGFHTNSSYKADYNLDMSTRYFSIIRDSVMHGLPSQDRPTTHRSPSGGTMRFGESPVYIHNASYNNSFGSSIHFNPLFLGALSEIRYHDIITGTYAVYTSGGTKIIEESLNKFPREPLMVEPAQYSLILDTYDYRVKNAKGHLTLKNTFDLTKSVPDAPVITSFVMLNGQQKPGNNFSRNENAIVRFSSKIYAYPFQLPDPQQTKAFYRKYKSADWIPLTVSSIRHDVENEGSFFTVPLASATAVDSVAIDLKIRIVDSTGNATEQILSPAFSVGNWIDDGTTPVKEPEQIGTPVSFALQQNFPNPFNPATTIKYDLPAATEVTLSVFDILGREVKELVDQFQTAGTHSVKFEAGDLASGIYFYRINAGPYTALRKMLFVK